jgi:trimethylamine--corrinoid protein Co-methyltransferase
MVQQYMKGLPVNDETLAIDIMDKVGPGGHYLYEDHTFNHFKDVWYTDIFDRSVYDIWVEGGSVEFDERLRQKTKRMMEHQPKALPDKVLKEFETMQKSWE